LRLTNWNLSNLAGAMSADVTLLSDFWRSSEIEEPAADGEDEQSPIADASTEAGITPLTLCRAKHR